MRRLLDRLYLISGMLSAGFISAICLLVTAQVILNLITKLGGTAFSLTIPSYADFSGYFLAAASFLALAYTFRQGGHIRVTLFLSRIKNKAVCFMAELFALGVSSMASIYATFHIAELVWESYKFDDKSTGIVSIPIWIPQFPVIVGMTIFSIALLDAFVSTLRAGTSVIENKENH